MRAYRDRGEVRRHERYASIQQCIERSVIPGYTACKACYRSTQEGVLAKTYKMGVCRRCMCGLNVLQLGAPATPRGHD